MLHLGELVVQLSTLVPGETVKPNRKGHTMVPVSSAGTRSSRSLGEHAKLCMSIICQDKSPPTKKKLRINLHAHTLSIHFPPS